MFDIVKGWPSEGALDEAFPQADGEDVSVGDIVMIVDGECAAATFDDAGVNVDVPHGIVVDVCPVTSNATVLMSDCIVEIDSDHYAEAVYAHNGFLTAAAGKFTPVTADERIVGQMLKMNGTTGVFRIKIGTNPKTYMAA